MDLSNLKPAEGSKHSDNFRRGRGHASGNGKTAGKGHKGQKARSGAPRIGFEGGQMPLYRRLPKRGFTNRNTKEIVAINVSELERFRAGSNVTIEKMMEVGLIKDPKDGVKILGNGELTKKLNVKANAFSETAKTKIEEGAFGGKGSFAHKACIVGDTVGDPFKDTSGPSLNILIKLMSMVSIVMAGLTVAFS